MSRLKIHIIHLTINERTLNLKQYTLLGFVIKVIFHLFYLWDSFSSIQCLFLLDPCSGMSCGVNSRASCTLTKTRKARCVCVPDCKGTFQGRVCSTDQRTYASECALLTESCHTKKKIDIDYYSNCKGWKLSLLLYTP